MELSNFRIPKVVTKHIRRFEDDGDDNKSNDRGYDIEGNISSIGIGSITNENGRSMLMLVEKRFDRVMALAWINLTFYKKSWFSNVKTPILCQLRGQINFGTMTALMGPSGAGKTTLLRCINGANRSGLSQNTEIYVNKFETIRPCFVVQDVKQHLLTDLTVNESLMYASKLKNRSLSVKDADLKENFNHKQNIYKLMSDLLLTDCAKTKVSLCSGGEQKRLVIAMELTAMLKPNLICIDEPTSGLDSNAAEMTIQCLQNIARKHRLAVVTSIHQPNSDVLMLFDQLYVLAKGGRCVYSGHPNTLKDHLIDCGITLHDYQIPIEILLKISSKMKKEFISNLDIEVIDLGPPDEIVSLMTKTYESQKYITKSCSTCGQLSIGGFDGNERLFHPIDFWHLLCRSVMCSWVRGWKLTLTIVLVFILGAFMLVYLFRTDIGTDGACVTTIHERVNNSQANVTNDSSSKLSYDEPLYYQNLKFIFFLFAFYYFIHLSAVSLTFPSEVQIFLNEHRNRWYSTTSYYLAKSLTELPIIMIVAYVYLWIGYYGSSQPDMNKWYNGIWNIPERFALFTLSILMGLANVQGMALTVGIACAKSFQMAIVVSIGLFLIFILFGGFFLPLESLSDVLKGFTYCSYIKHSFYSVLTVLYGRGRCTYGSLILFQLHIKEEEFWESFYWQIGICVFWRISGLIALLIQAHPDLVFKRKRSRKMNSDKFGSDNEGFSEVL